MSQYLTNFYCGSKRGKCNYNEPVNYEKLLNRDFDPELNKILNDCQGADFKKGYCCDPMKPDIHKTMDDEYMEEMNQKFEANIFTKDESGDFFPGQIPLLKPKTQNGILKAIEVCTCGGTKDEYQKCINENCKGFKPATRYQYCKLGSELDKINCVVRNNNKSSNQQKRCKLQTVDPSTQYTYSHQFKINNLFPDCYQNLCNKKPRLQILDKLISSSTTNEYKYHSILGDSMSSYQYVKTPEDLQKDQEALENGNKSLFQYFQM